MTDSGARVFVTNVILYRGTGRTFRDRFLVSVYQRCRDDGQEYYEANCETLELNSSGLTVTAAVDSLRPFVELM